ncbi:hypothetical protein SCLCIDRAFT_1218495 [Scleroderma citrinum Foug A]|uniref:Uncharacterized protein n=1 Tax=Scleroderma citrinum Foug A TaxID=1036808 RepID=A0A0C3DQT4_9AGAM|nr:hypothetical protein SCLCIDRAFT_1218495 [Scleroderma citrinum Foug A]
MVSWESWIQGLQQNRTQDLHGYVSYSEAHPFFPVPTPSILLKDGTTPLVCALDSPV